jgi:hypothetical protein
MYPAGILFLGIAVVLLDTYWKWKDMRQGH